MAFKLSTQKELERYRAYRGAHSTSNNAGLCPVPRCAVYALRSVAELNSPA
jgi:hypothetical protein